MTKYKKMSRRRKPQRRGKQSNKAQKQFVRGIFLLIAVTLLIFFVFGNHGLLQYYKLRAERKEIQHYISEIRQERESLKVEKNKLEHDLEYIEKLAREKYRMVKKGEKIFKVIAKDSLK
ncbi:MAG: septum formation initiator family protein [Candidatus Marinimicrobia bacterium]|jgi:cell division protein FtsB|nr:septum formation initiator family protein [Candidatus Neomarinimicrobiota bacterium]MBT3497115.1 septum formation initiator family protein [Candidatus Neomarinimicrobiota bacterium]MBT3691950.1 septum formation initiator family protein [Candidatus Neomarinimicrobiota bacterium]MBT3732019.1 septum formation initiator family protein [Candidatus Neomarinimicrobiota bacterium]MBT4144191.1 septum formation initiator family protein [Candidatus Neomarinimicrobiota bacterium]